MKKIKVQDAIGMPLFHDLTAILENGYKGARFKRGHIIREEDIPVMLDMGKAHVFVWEGEPDLVHEEDAAKWVVKSALGRGILVPEPSEGRFPLKAAYPGLFVLNREGLLAINSVPDFTFASLRHASPVQAGDVVVGARIVPLTTTRQRVAAAVAAAERYAPVFQVLPYRPLKVGLVITGNEIYEGRIQDAFADILRPKVAAFGGETLTPVLCPDDSLVIKAAVLQFLNQGAELVLMTGGMSVDPDDLTPTVMRELADEFIFQGLPVQPGNMLTIANCQGATLMGVPGASMHAPFTSLDLFLPRVFAGLPITAADAIELGEGGLSICRNL